MVKLDTKKITTFGAAVVLLVFLHYIGLLLPAENLLTRVSRPLLSRMYSVSSFFRKTYNAEENQTTLENEVKNLKSQVNNLIVENSNLKNLEDENQTLRDYLKFFTQNKEHYVMADIISRGGVDSDTGETILINKGAKDGIDIGYPVISGQGIIVGKIMDVKDSISEACLTVNPACKIAVTVQNQDKTSGIAEGDLGLIIKMNFIPQTKSIKMGDIIITSGLETDIPRGLVIGTVAQVNKENNELWQDAVVEPLVDPNDLTIVSVLIPN